MTAKVVIIDYGVGNLTSVYNALGMLSVEACVSADPGVLAEATHLILPGVGSFKEGMEGLRVRNLIPLLQDEVLQKKKKLLGICLGMQLLATVGFEHGESKGLGFLPGNVVLIDTKATSYRLPHIGWNTVSIQGKHTSGSGFTTDPIFYFVHSYHFLPDDRASVAGITDYGEKIVAIVQSENIWGTQFHPEKSDTDGLQIFKNFVSLA